MFRNRESKTITLSALYFQTVWRIWLLHCCHSGSSPVSQLGRDGSLLAGPSPSSLLPLHYSQCPKSELVRGQNDVNQILPLIQCKHRNAFPSFCVCVCVCVCVCACVCVCVCVVAQACQTLATPQTVACQPPLSVGFSRPEYWSGLPFPSPKKFCFMINQHLTGTSPVVRG